MHQEEQTNHGKDYWISIGRTYCGPLVCDMVQFIRNNLPEGTDKLLFFSRDGYTPMEVYRSLYDDIPSEYVYTSRFLSRALGDDPYGSDLNREATSVFLSGTDRTLEEERGHYSEYICNKVGYSKNPVFVDATTQKFTSQKHLCSILDRSDILGIYYAVLGRQDIPHIAYADRSCQHLPWSYVNLIELSMAASEPPVRGIDSDFNPIYEKDLDPREVRRIQMSEWIREGIFQYVESVKDHVPYLGKEKTDRLMKELIRKERREKGELWNMEWPVDMVNKDYQPLLFRPSMLKYILKMKAVKVLRKVGILR